MNQSNSRAEIMSHHVVVGEEDRHVVAVVVTIVVEITIGITIAIEMMIVMIIAIGEIIGMTHQIVMTNQMIHRQKDLHHVVALKDGQVVLVVVGDGQMDTAVVDVVDKVMITAILEWRTAARDTILINQSDQRI